MAFGPGFAYEHAMIAADTIGRRLPPGTVVHHVNGIPCDNRRKNLVICQSASYHKLLHERAEALAACGDADSSRCIYCQRWDNPAKNPDFQHRRSAYHRNCRAEMSARLNGGTVSSRGIKRQKSLEL
jgi:hypothetical protein